MSKKKLVVYDDQILVDLDLVFQAIRDANGDWKTVEREFRKMLETVQGME
jgi:hypothetical protein